MPYLVNTPIQITHGTLSTNYLISQKHRGNPTNEISSWTVDFDSEVICFTSTFQNTWHDGNNGWGIIPLPDMKLQILGGNLKNTELVLAKFVVNANQWHGYPADIRNKPHDKPLPGILQLWYNAGHISKSMMVRIKQGQL